MNLPRQRNLFLLSEVERATRVTQRLFSAKLGGALGLTNLYLKCLARKGHIKLTTIPAHRIKYLLTPKGIVEKSRLTYEYMQYSLSYYRDMRDRLKHVLSGLSHAGIKEIIIYGNGDLAELAYLTLRAMNLTLVGFVNSGQSQTFLSYPVWSIKTISWWTYGGVTKLSLIRQCSYSFSWRT